MDTYNPQSKCPKCAAEHVSTTWRSALILGGTLERRCANCGYTWDQKPLDSDSAHKGTSIRKV